MRLWTLQKRRSARRQARLALADLRLVDRWHWRAHRARQELRIADVQTIAVVAVLVHLPLLLYIGTKPGTWIAGAWQISAVLVGLIVTLVIFLLQAASDHSLSSDATFRAVLRHTYVLWPVSLAIAFIAALAVIQRFDGGSAPPGALETYTLAVFVVQVLLFGFAFLRATRIVSPEGVSSAVGRSFRDAMDLAVEGIFRERITFAILSEACRAQRVSWGSFLASGWRITPSAGGYVVDVDTDLPRRLRWFRVNGTVTITAEIGNRRDERLPIARSMVEPRPWLVREVRHGVRMTRRQPRAQPPLDVFNDALGLARRAFTTGTPAAQDAAVDLIAGCVVAYQDAVGTYA